MSFHHQAYQNLLRELCRITNTPEDAIETIVSTGTLNVDGVDFSVSHSDAAPSLLTIMCELHKPNDIDDITYYKRLLQSNSITMITGGPILGIEPESGLPIMLNQFQLSMMTATSLEAGLRETAKTIKEWGSGEAFKQQAPLLQDASLGMRL